MLPQAWRVPSGPPIVLAQEMRQQTGAHANKRQVFPASAFERESIKDCRSLTHADPHLAQSNRYSFGGF